MANIINGIKQDIVTIGNGIKGGAINGVIATGVNNINSITTVVGTFFFQKIKDRVARSITFTVGGGNRDNNWMEDAFYAIVYTYNNVKRQSNLDLYSMDSESKEDTSVYYRLGDGVHKLRYRNYDIMVFIDTKPTADAFGRTKPVRTYSVSTFNLGEKFVTQFEKDMISHRDDIMKFKTDLGTITVYKDCHENDGWTYWDKMSPIHKRSIKTIYTDPDIKRKIVDTVNRFFGEKQFYHDHGIAHNLKILMYGKPGPQPNSTLIPTPAGMKPMGELQVGDEVFTADGVPTKVTGVYPQGQQEIFELHFSDGRSARCTGGHLWKVYTQSHGKLVPSVMPLIQIYHDMYLRSTARSFAIPNNGPAAFEPREVPIDPYTVGILITNGCLTDKYLRISENNFAIPQLIAERNGLVAQKRSLDDGDYGYYFMDADDRKVKTETFLANLSELIGVLAGDKRIPEDYLFNSVEARRELLRGLMDGDGSIVLRPRMNWSSPNCTFTTTSETLAKQVQWLARSLGYRASINRDRRVEKYRNGYCASVRLSVPPLELPQLFRVRRKAERAIAAAEQFKRTTEVTVAGRTLTWHRDHSKIWITRIEQLELVEPVSCIMVDDEEHLYQTEDFVVTHNTGKDSIAKMIASEWHRNIYYTVGGKGGRFIPDAITSRNVTNPLFMISDIDRYPFLINDEMKTDGAQDNVTHVEENKQTFAHMINALDGVMSGEDRIIIMTTNHIEKFSPTFLRPGRIDLMIEIPPVSPWTFRKFTYDFYGKLLPENITLSKPDITIPDLQADVIFTHMPYGDFVAKYVGKLKKK